MNEFKAISAVGSKSGYWMDFKSNRQSKREAQRQARRTLNQKTFKEIFQENQNKG